MRTLKDQSGFTLIELLVIVVLLGIILSVGCSRYITFREDENGNEVKANIHTIQIVLERYAVDSGGIYPLILYGGDRTDSFTTRTSPDYKDSTGKMQSGISEFNGDVDVLLEYGYLAKYPVNPFRINHDFEKYGRLITQPSQYNLPQSHYRVNIWANHTEPVNGHSDRAQQLVERQVGGKKANLMWDVSEGQRHAPFPIVVVPEPTTNSPGNYYNYVNPVSGFNLHSANPPETAHLFFLLPGNFYYYATFNTPGGYGAFIDGNLNQPYQIDVTGYNLAGYGSIKNPAKDVYNIMGDFSARSLFTLNNPNQDFTGLSPEEVRDKIYVGADGRNDGVIIVVQGGPDRKSIPKNEIDPDLVLMLGSNKEEDL